MKIGLLSDTHGYLDPALFNYFDQCDEIWHAGDIGDVSVIKELSDFKPVKAVFGNIDDQTIRSEFPEELEFSCEGASVYITHIGGKPFQYNKEVLKSIKENRPDIFVCGHSHILRVIYDKHNKLLYLNPGAAGKHGLHKVRTALRFEIKNGKARNMEIIELGNRSERIV